MSTGDLLGVTLMLIIGTLWVTGRCFASTRFEVAGGNVSSNREPMGLRMIYPAACRPVKRACFVGVQNEPEPEDHHIAVSQIRQLLRGDDARLLFPSHPSLAINNCPCRHGLSGVVRRSVGKCKFLVKQEREIPRDYSRWRGTGIRYLVLDEQSLTAVTQRNRSGIGIRPNSDTWTNGGSERFFRDFGLLFNSQPLQPCEHQVACTDKRQDDIDDHRWRGPSFFVGLCLFLSSYGLFFLSMDRFTIEDCII